MPPGRSARPVADVIAPTRDDALVAASSHGIGGRLGAHALPHPFWTPLRVVLVLVTLSAVLGLARTAPCSTGAWWGADQFSDLCYSDLPLGYVDSGLAERAVPYADTGGRYPATTSTPPVAATAWLAAVATHALLGWPDASARGNAPVPELAASSVLEQEATTYFFVASLLLFGCAAATAALLARGSGRRRWDAAAFAAAPALLLAGTIGWDLLAVLLAVSAWYVWTRGRPATAGVLAGAGIATAFWPLAVLGAAVAVGLRAGRRQDAGIAALAATTTWTVVQLPALRLGLRGWWETVNPRLGDPAGYGSLWGLVADTGVSVDAGLMATVVVLLTAAVSVAVVVLTWRTARPRVAQVALLLLVGWVVVWPVYSPQQVVWLLPLAVLARPRWRDLLIWQAGEACYFLAIWMHLSGATLDAGSVDRVYALAIVTRVAAECWLAGMVVRDLREPWSDPVAGSQSGQDDPVEGGGGETHVDVDLGPDRRRRLGAGDEQQADLHVRWLDEPASPAADPKR